MKATKLILPALLIIFWVQIASAFYDPNLGRWINRDPIGESGFELTQNHAGAGWVSGSLQYTFVANDPISHVDFLGLELRFANNCSASQITQITTEFANRCASARAANCFRCLSAKGRNGMEQMCNGNGRESPLIYCNDASYSPCANRQRCGRTDGAGDVHLCMNNIGPNAPFNCGDLGCVLLHEGTHAVGGVGPDPSGPGGSGDNRGYQVDQCAGCP